MHKRNVLNSPRLLELRKRRQRILLSKIMIYFLGFVVCISVLALVSRIPGLNINQIEISGNKLVDMEEIRSAVKGEISGNYLWFFPKSNILFYPKNGIKNLLNNKFKRLQNINVALDGRRTLRVTVDERTALYTWCGEALPVPTLSTTLSKDAVQKCYFLDKDGYIFDEAPYFSGNVYFKFYGPIADATNPPGAYFLKENFSSLVSFKKSLEAMNLKPVMLVKGDGVDAKFILSSSTTGTVPEIDFKIDADFKTVAEKLQSAIDVEPLKSNLKNKYSSLLYINLKLDNKVIYKFK
ncbi:MAG: hypothetical protein WCI76_03290 [bacterium]